MLGSLVIRAGGSRAGAAGFGLGVSGWSYALTQCRAVMLYLKLAVWPHPLVVDYGTDMVTHPVEVVPQALGLLLLLAGTAVALWRRPALGFLGAWFFAILAPSSSAIPLVTQTMAEHRMYLPLAAVIALAVCGGYDLFARLGRESGVLPAAGGWRYLATLLALSAGLGILTAQRNETYRSALAIWSDTVAKRPDNARARDNLGNALHAAGRTREAIAQFEEALRLKPDSAETHNNLGNALSTQPGRQDDAIVQFQAALRLKPDSFAAHYNLANLWLNTPGRLPDAIAEYAKALRLQPDSAAAHNNLGSALARLPGRLNDAIAEYEEALRLQPDIAEAHFNLAVILLDLPGRRDEARAHLEAGLRLQPGNDAARKILAGLQGSQP
jgi:Flp pilus assembly protein TadD